MLHSQGEPLHLGIAVRARRIGLVLAGRDGTLRVFGCRDRQDSRRNLRRVHELLLRFLKGQPVARVVVEEAREPRRLRARQLGGIAAVLARRLRVPCERVSYRTARQCFLDRDDVSVMPLLRLMTAAFPALAPLACIRVPRRSRVAKLVAAALALRSAQLHS